MTNANALDDTVILPTTDMTDQTGATPNPGELLKKLREIKDQRDSLSARDSELYKRQQEVERDLIAFHERTGTERVAGHGMSVTFDPKAMRVGYVPEKWDELHKWFVANGYGYCIQRRLSDAKVLELVDNGVALPEGLKTESYVKLNTRRTGAAT